MYVLFRDARGREFSFRRDEIPSRVIEKVFRCDDCFLLDNDAGEIIVPDELGQFTNLKPGTTYTVMSAAYGASPGSLLEIPHHARDTPTSFVSSATEDMRDDTILDSLMHMDMDDDDDDDDDDDVDEEEGESTRADSFTDETDGDDDPPERASPVHARRGAPSPGAARRPLAKRAATNGGVDGAGAPANGALPVVDDQAGHAEGGSSSPEGSALHTQAASRRARREDLRQRRHDLHASHPSNARAPSDSDSYNAPGSTRASATIRAPYVVDENHTSSGPGVGAGHGLETAPTKGGGHGASASTSSKGPVLQEVSHEKEQANAMPGHHEDHTTHPRSSKEYFVQPELHAEDSQTGHLSLDQVQSWRSRTTSHPGEKAHEAPAFHQPSLHAHSSGAGHLTLADVQEWRSNEDLSSEQHSFPADSVLAEGNAVAHSLAEPQPRRDSRAEQSAPLRPREAQVETDDSIDTEEEAPASFVRPAPTVSMKASLAKDGTSAVQSISFVNLARVMRIVGRSGASAPRVDSSGSYERRKPRSADGSDDDSDERDSAAQRRVPAHSGDAGATRRGERKPLRRNMRGKRVDPLETLSDEEYFEELWKKKASKKRS